MSKDCTIAEMNKEYVKRYLNFDYVCPYCGEEDGITYDSVDFSGGHILQRTWCVNCHGEWVDIYKLTEITPLENKEYIGRAHRNISTNKPISASLRESFIDKGGRNPPPSNSKRPPHPPAQYPKIYIQSAHTL